MASDCLRHQVRAEPPALRSGRIALQRLQGHASSRFVTIWLWADCRLGLDPHPRHRGGERWISPELARSRLISPDDDLMTSDGL